MPRLLHRLALAALALPAAAQSVLVVDDDGGPGVYTEISSAVAQASDGDVILVRDGRYDHSLDLVGLAVAVVADAGATPELVVTTEPGQAAIRLGGLAPGATQILRGLEILGEPVIEGQGALVEAHAGGTVWIEGCTLRRGTPTLRALAGSHVVLQGATVEGAGSFFSGFILHPPGAAIEVAGTLELGASVARGGEGYDGKIWDPITILGPDPGGPGVRVQPGGVLDVAASAIAGGAGGDGVSFFVCYDAEDGGAGLVLEPGATVARLGDATLAGGAPGAPGGGCPPAAVDGPALVNDGGAAVDALATPIATLALGGPYREGETLAGAATAPPGAAAFLAFAPAAAPLHVPALAGVLLVPPFGPLSGVVALGAVPGDGVLPIAAAVGDLGAGVAALPLFAQVATCTGSGCALGGGATVVLLDAAY